MGQAKLLQFSITHTWRLRFSLDGDSSSSASSRSRSSAASNSLWLYETSINKATAMMAKMRDALVLVELRGIIVANQVPQQCAVKTSCMRQPHCVAVAELFDKTVHSDDASSRSSHFQSPKKLYFGCISNQIYVG